MKNNLLKFFYKLFILVLLIYGLDFIIGYALNRLFFTQKYGLDYRVTYAVNETKADLLILGSSKAKHHYSPAILEDSTRLSYYDTGREGTDILYHYAILKCILTRYKPKVILLDFFRRSLEYSPHASDRLASLLPYYNSHPEIRGLLDTKSPFEKIKRLSHIYPYNSMVYNILARNTTILKSKEYDFNIKGYVPSPRGDSSYLESLLQDPNSNKIPDYNIDSTKEVVFKEFIKACIDSGVKLYVIASPYLSTKYVHDRSFQVAKSICQIYKVPFLDFSFTQGISDNFHYFRDGEHMDDEGAIEFSKRLSLVLKSSYPPKVE